MKKLLLIFVVLSFVGCAGYYPRINYDKDGKRSMINWNAYQEDKKECQRKYLPKESEIVEPSTTGENVAYVVILGTIGAISNAIFFDWIGASANVGAVVGAVSGTGAGLLTYDDTEEIKKKARDYREPASEQERDLIERCLLNKGWEMQK